MTTTDGDGSAEPLDFSHLSPTQFEAFCFELLHCLDFKNIDWRKGAAGNASPADQGRDIQCEAYHTAPDGTLERELWFVECKHYAKAVPPAAIEPLLSWAAAERPAKALIITSACLSNPCKEYIRKYEENNRPAFRVLWWENTRLMMMTAGLTQLLNRYGLIEREACLDLLHPAHVRFLKMSAPNTLGYLFGLLDELDPKQRDEIFGLTFLSVVNPRYKDAPPDYKGTIGELMLDPVHYHAFKDKCRALTSEVAEHFLVSSIVEDALKYLLHRGDVASVGVLQERFDGIIANCRRQIAAGAADADILKKMIADMERFKRTAPGDARDAYDLYQLFCERVVGRLFDEDRPDILRAAKSAMRREKE